MRPNTAIEPRLDCDELQRVAADDADITGTEAEGVFNLGRYLRQCLGDDHVPGDGGGDSLHHAQMPGAPLQLADAALVGDRQANVIGESECDVEIALVDLATIVQLDIQ